MTKEEKKQILEDVLERAYVSVRATPTEQLAWPDCRTLLKNISLMEGMVKYGLADFPGPIPEPAQPETENVGVADPQNQEAPEVPDEPAPEAPAVKMEDVRAALAKARGKGVNVSEIIRGFGVETFPQIEKSQYPEVLKKLEEALKNAT